MFVYFDRNGVIREVINDLSIREGGINANAIYCYFDGITPDDVFGITQWGDLTKTNETSFIDNVAKVEIPYNKDRDLKFFKEFKSYEFYVYELKEIGSQGLAQTTIRIVKLGGVFPQGKLTFNVQDSILQTDSNITQSQFDYLVTLVARNNLEIESIKYNADIVTPVEIEALPNRDALKIHAKPNFLIDKMTEFINSKDIEDMWFGCGIDTSETVGFALNFDNAQIGKLQLLINGNKYGTPFNLKCYAVVNGERELVDTITIPPMESGVFAFYRFNVYRTDVTRIEILQEEGWKKDRFYIKAVEPFRLSGKGQYVITQKNGIVSKIDNPDENYLDTVYQFVYDQMEWLKANIITAEENAEKTGEDRAYIDIVATAVREIETRIQEQKPQIESDLEEAQRVLSGANDTLFEINSKLNQPNGFLELGADGKIPASRIPFEQIVNVFAIQRESELTTLNRANVGDIAYVVVDGKATENYRLVAEPYSNRNNWILQVTTFTSNSIYAERSGLADNSSMINGVSIKQISQSDYDKLADKTGIYIVIV